MIIYLTKATGRQKVRVKMEIRRDHLILAGVRDEASKPLCCARMANSAERGTEKETNERSYRIIV